MGQWPRALSSLGNLVPTITVGMFQALVCSVSANPRVVVFAQEEASFGTSPRQSAKVAGREQ